MQTGTVLSRLALAGALIVGALPALAQNATTPAAKLDIAGVRIGMTEAEAVKAVQAFDASAKLKRNLATFPYFDGVNSLESPEFLDQIGVTMAGSGIGIWFASPPAEPRVIAVMRRGSAPQPPGSEQMMASLVARYGPYAARTPPVAGGRAVVHWSEDGKPQCSVDKDRKGQRIPWNNAMGTLLQPGAVKVLEQYARQRVPHLVDALGPTPDVARCGIVLRYEWNSEPVQNFEAWLVDQGGMVASNRRSAEWVEQLKAEAARKLKGQGAAPKF
jgi:hypothetical protein